jgi:hypothetical protein
VERQNPMITKVNRFVCESEHDMQDNKPLAWHTFKQVVKPREIPGCC